MATIENRIALDDGMSGVLAHIEGAVNSLASSFDRARRSAEAMSRAASGLPGGSASMPSLSPSLGSMVSLTASLSRIEALLSSIDRTTSHMSAGMARAGSSSSSTASHLSSASSSMSSMAGGAGAVASGMASASSSAGLLDRLLESSVGQLTMATLAAKGLETAISAIAGMPMQVFNASQEYAGIESRMRLIAGSQEAVEDMNRRIYESAMRSNASFQTMADSVAKIGLTAKESFPDPNEIVPFMEGIQKLLSIGGTTGINAEAAMLQLTQALGSGVLQGDEFRSIAENAPLIEKMIAKELSRQTGENITQGMLKKLASEGKVTSDLIKASILNNMDEINQAFGDSANTASSRLSNIGAMATYAFIPVFQKINELFNSDALAGFVEKIGAGIYWLANEVLYLVNALEGVADSARNAISTMGDFLSDVGIIDLVRNNTAMLIPIILGVAGAYAVMKIATLAAYLSTIPAKLASFQASMMATAGTIAHMYATEGLTAALLACPISWIALAIIALVAVFYLAVEAVNFFAGTSISATGIIFAVFAWLFASIYNWIAVAWNFFLVFAQFLANVFVDPLTATRNFFAMMWNEIVSLVAAAVSNIISMIAKIPGMDEVVGGVDVGSMAQGLQFDIKPIDGGVDLSGYRMDMANPAEWASSGYSMGEAFEDKIGALANFKLPDMPTIPDQDKQYGRNLNDGRENAGPQGAGGSAGGGSGRGGGGGGHGKEIAKNTGRMADKMDMIDEDIKFFRDYASQEAVNQYTTATVKISMGGITNNMASDMDIDGMVRYLNDSLIESMQAGAEKVHI